MKMKSVRHVTGTGSGLLSIKRATQELYNKEEYYIEEEKEEWKERKQQKRK